MHTKMSKVRRGEDFAYFAKTVTENTIILFIKAVTENTILNTKGLIIPFYNYTRPLPRIPGPLPSIPGLLPRIPL